MSAFCLSRPKEGTFGPVHLGANRRVVLSLRLTLTALCLGLVGLLFSNGDAALARSGTKAENRARQAEEANAESSPNRASARALAEKLVHTQPAIRSHQVHWVLGIDVSGSMDALIPALTATLGTLSHRTMRPGDRITLYAFDDAILRYPHLTGRAGKPLPPTEVEDAITLQSSNDDRKAQFYEHVRHNIRVRPGHRGTQVDACFRQLFEHGARIAAHDKTRIPLLLLITDRDNDDGGTSPQDIDLSAYVKLFGGTPTSEKAYASDSLKLDAGGKRKEIVLLLSALRKTEGVAPAALEREKPVEPPQVITTPASDPFHHLRLALRWLPLPFGVLALLFGILTWRTPFGRLVAHHQGTAELVSWGQPARRLAASHNALGLALKPSRTGMAEPLVLQATLQASDARARALRLTGIDPYLVRDEQGLWEREVVLKPRHTLDVRVRDSHGEVARGELEWVPNPVWQTLKTITLGLLVLFVLSLPADYFGQTRLEAPVAESSRSIKEEPL